MRILHLAKRRYTNKDALAERFGRVYQLPLYWSARNHQVELALVDYHSLQKEQVAQDGFTTHSLPILDPLSFWRLKRIARALQPDVIVASGDCFVGLIGYHISRSACAPFVFDVYDDYSSFGSYRAFLGWNALDFLLNRADLVLYASRTLADRHFARSKWVLTPNGVDTEKFRPGDTATARRRIGLDGNVDTLVGYFGSMERDRGVDDLIVAVGQLHAIDSNIRLLLCGTLRPDLQPLPPWINYMGVVPHVAMPDYLNACDVLALPYRRSQMMDMGASCKIAEYLLCERPLVATHTPNFSSNFPMQAVELGPAMCSPADAADLARAISLQLQERRICSRPEDHAWPTIANNVLSSILGLGVHDI
ncbi:glycosyltransferase [Dokdonella sp.]|uniref:glycosyltransferase n=1 Tax=Dokdonella sp. TaxID=2291710 RepID=UPI0035287E66